MKITKTVTLGAKEIEEAIREYVLDRLYVRPEAMEDQPAKPDAGPRPRESRAVKEGRERLAGASIRLHYQETTRHMVFDNERGGCLGHDIPVQGGFESASVEWEEPT